VSLTPHISEWLVDEIMAGRWAKSSFSGVERASSVGVARMATPGAAVVG
jgi:hypothetical protein